jgi:5-methylcytosine-specific restriction endonuclease McrA
VKEFHHKKSVDAGGDDDVSNCLALCKACHSRAHTTTGQLGRV